MSDWRTVSVTALAPGMWVKFEPIPEYGEDDPFTWPVLALLHQVHQVDGVDRVVLGVLNPDLCEVEAIDVEDRKSMCGEVVQIIHRPAGTEWSE